MAHAMKNFDPFQRGHFPVGVRTLQARDTARSRMFPCEIWYPAAAEYGGQDANSEYQDSYMAPFPPPAKVRRQMAVRNAAPRLGTYPLIVFSHSSGGDRRQSTFLCTHLSSHGYVVAAVDHSEVVAPELARKDGETPEQKAARWEACMANRVPDVRFLLDHLLGIAGSSMEPEINPARIGIVGHSFGGWTALATPEVDSRIRAVVALAPGGASNPKPGILPAKLTFNWSGNIPTLYLVAENDNSLPLDGMYELFERTPSTKQMLILRRADHGHFMDNVEELHEAVRKMPFPGTAEMRPIAELSSGEQAHLFVRGLTLAHLDANLRQDEDAHRFLAADLESELRNRGVDVISYKP